MSLPKGRTNNPNGRPAGSKNVEVNEYRKFAKTFIEKFNTSGQFKKTFNKLSANDKMKVYLDLMQYILPKLQSVSTEITGAIDINWSEVKTYEIKSETDESVRLS